MKQVYFSFKQKGISLLEVMLSLAVIAIILLLATRYFGIANTNTNMNTLSSQVVEVQQAVEQFYNLNMVNSGGGANTAPYPTSWTQIQGLVSATTAAHNTPFPGATIDIATGGDGKTAPKIEIAFGTTANATNLCQGIAARFSSNGGKCNGTTASINGMIPAQ